MRSYVRHIMCQMLIVCSWWFSMHYGWGMEVKSWGVLATWGIGLSVLMLPMSIWCMRGIPKEVATEAASKAAERNALEDVEDI